MPREENNDTHQTIPTPSPRERSLLVTVEESVFVNNPDVLPAAGTSYGDMARELFAQDYNQNFDDYVYTGQMPNAKTRGVLAFAKFKTPEEAFRPFRRYWKKNGNHRWPPLLKNYIVISDNSMPRSSNIITNGQPGIVTGPNFYDRYVYIPDCNEGTRFLLEEYFGPIEFVIPRYRAPVATGVQSAITGSSFPESLHDDIELPGQRMADAMYYGGNAYSGNGTVEGQSFPRTNFKTWLPYVLFAEQEYQDGGWYMQRIRVFPPLRPKAIRQ